MPALVVLLIHAEDEKGTPLTRDEVHAMRDSGTCIMMKSVDAQRSIAQFVAMLPTDGTARSDALIKTTLVDGAHRAFMWLNNTATEGDHFTAELFEVPDTLPSYKVGDRYVVTREELMDWMVNENGRLIGGFSLRYNRAQLSEAEKLDFDRHIGVTEYT